MSYDLLDHGMMVADPVRVGAYERAIRQVVRPGDIVADIGAGTGLLSMAACAAGASRVYAIEPGSIIDLARTLARTNGCEDRITFIRKRAEAVTLPERADVIVMDVRGVLPDEQVALAADARRRLLAPRGILIPAQDALWGALVEAPLLFDRHADVGVEEWRAAGVDVRPVQQGRVNRWSKCRVEPDQLATSPARWSVIDYAAAQPELVKGGMSWTVARARDVHGVVTWFESTLADGVELSNRPGDPPALYGQRYFPWPRAVRVQEGDGVTVEITGQSTLARAAWRWRTTICRSRSESLAFDQPGAHGDIA